MWDCKLFVNNLQVSCGTDNCLQINYKFNVELIVDWKLITNSM